jgi:hypothetical protein
MCTFAVSSGLPDSFSLTENEDGWVICDYFVTGRFPGGFTELPTLTEQLVSLVDRHLL